MEAKDTIIKTLCLECCGEDRCQRYPKLARSCSRFYPMEKAYKAGQESEKAHWIGEIERQVHDAYEGGMRKVVEFLNKTSMDAHTLIFQVSEKGWLSKLKEWGIK